MFNPIVVATMLLFGQSDNCAVNYSAFPLPEESIHLAIAPILVDPKLPFLGSAHSRELDLARDGYLNSLASGIAKELSRRSVFDPIKLSHFVIPLSVKDTVMEVSKGSSFKFMLPNPSKVNFVSDSSADVILFIEDLSYVQTKSRDSYNFNNAPISNSPMSLVSVSFNTGLRRATNVSFAFMYLDNHRKIVLAHGKSEFEVSFDVDDTTADDEKELVDDAVNSLLCRGQFATTYSKEDGDNAACLNNDISALHGREIDSISTWFNSAEPEIIKLIQDSLTRSLQYPDRPNETSECQFFIFPDGHVLFNRTIARTEPSSLLTLNPLVVFQSKRFCPIKDSCYVYLRLLCRSGPSGISIPYAPSITYRSKSPWLPFGGIPWLIANTHAPTLREIVAEKVQNDSSYFYSAFAKRQNNKPNEGGQVNVKIMILGTGNVLFANVIGSTLDDPDFEKTLTDRIKTWKFDPLGQPSSVTEVTCPIAFKR